MAGTNPSVSGTTGVFKAGIFREFTRNMYDKNFEIPGIEIKPGPITNLALGSQNID